MKRFLILVAVLIMSFAASCPAQQLTYPAEQTANIFTSTNQFMLGVQFGPVTFANLPASPANGTIDWCSNCTINSNPCTASGTGSFAYYQNGVWSCTGGGGGGGGSISLILGTANEITITGGSGPTTTLFLANPLITPGAVTVTGGLTATGVTDSGLTPGNCVQASTGGLLVTIVGACGTSSGTITATGSPSSGELTKFSGGTSITNGNLSGDVTTSNTLVTTVVNVNGVSYPTSPSTNTVPVVTGSNTVTYEIVPPAAGGTGIGNTATLTLGTSNINFALLGTGIVKNTTITGALTLAASSDVIALWSGTCNSSTFLNGAGACTSGGGGGSSALSSITAATGANTIANGNNGAQVWNWAQTSSSQTAFTFGETTAATGAGDLELVVKTLTGSTAIPLTVINSLNGAQTLCALCITPTWNTSGVVDAALLVNVTNASSAAGSLLADFQLNSVSQWNVTKAGQTTQLGNANVASDGVHAAAIDLLGLTTIPTFNGNSFALIGPNSASFTSWGIQMSSTSPSVSSLFRLGAAVSGGGGLVSQGGPIPIQGTDASILSSGTISASTGIVLCTDANGGATTSGCSGISTSWSSMTNPTTNLALSMGTNTSSFTSGDYGASPVTGVFNLTTSATSSTDTSYEFTITAPSTSYHNPLAVFVDNLTMWQICNLSSSHFGVSVVGNAVACNSINTSPLAKLIVEGTTITNLTLQREWMAPNTAVGDMNEWNTATPSGTGFYFLKGYAGVTSTDTSNGGGSLIFSIRGDGLFTGSFSGPGAVSNQQLGFATIGNTAANTLSNSPAFVDASLYAGSPDVCLQIKNAETALVSSGASAFQIVMPITNKAYCGTVPQATNGHGDIYFVGNAARARVYMSVSFAGISSGIRIHGTGPTGTANTSASNVQFVACNPLLHDDSYPGNSAGAPCAAYFNSSTNMPQATVSSITAAGGSPSTSTITLSSALSGTLPGKFAGRLLCVGLETPTTANGNCYEIAAEPTSGGTVFTVNSTNLVACNATCGGLAYLDTPMIQMMLNASTGATGFFVQFQDMSLDCAYLYACDNAVNGGDQEGGHIQNVQMFNATAVGYRKFVGNNPSGTSGAYYGNSGGGSHSGPDIGIWYNYQSEDCEIVSGGCYGTNSSVAGGANQQYAAGTLMACGNNTVLPLTTDAILSYSSSVSHSPCQRNFAGFVSDGIAMGTNTQSFYGINGMTISLKDVFNTGTHVEMPELVNGVGMFFAGPTQSVIGFHLEYCTTCIEVNGDATLNETWIEDGSTPMQGLTLVNADINNCSTLASGHPTTMWCIDLGAAQGTSNIMNVSIVNVSEGTGAHAIQNQLVSGGNCTNSSDKTILYEFQEMASPSGGYTLHSDCSTAVNVFANGLNASLFQSYTNCQLGGASGTASPAVCTSAPAGTIAVPASISTYTVDTTAVTANSQIIIQQIYDNSGIPSSPTCGSTAVNPKQSTRTASTSFGFTLTSTAQVSCFAYWIIN